MSRSKFDWLRPLLSAFVVFVFLWAGSPGQAWQNGPYYPGPVLDGVQHDAPFHPQDTVVWCWVACAKMVVESLGKQAPPQCAMLQQVYGAPCCQQPGLCLRGGYIQEIQNLIATFGYTASNVSHMGDGWQVLALLKETGAPLIGWVDKSHFVVITGMRVGPSPSGPLGHVRLHDPIRGVFDQPWPVFSNRLGAVLFIQ